MSDISNSTWFPVFTLLLGFATKYASDFFQDRRATDRERESRKATLHYKFIERRIEFQHQTLLKLQETTMSLARATGSMNHHDIMAFRSTGNWQKQLYPDGLSDDARVFQAEAMMLAARVKDDEIRKLVELFKGYCTGVVISLTKEDSEISMSNMTETFEILNQKIGGLLRGLDYEEQTLIAGIT